jgi:cellulose biosynthesis protein BcsQ
VSRSNNPDNPTFKSEDQEQNPDVNALFSSFRLDQTSYRTFNRHRSPKRPEWVEPMPTEQQRPPRTQIAIFSPMGGSGKSTLAASLAGVFWQLGKRVLLVDASPWSTLAFHYGATSVQAGLRSFFAPEGDLPIRILARDPNESSMPDIDACLAAAPADYVLFDLSGVTAKELAASLQNCQILLVPLIPDLSAVRNAEATATLLANLQNAPQRVMYVVNQMEDSPLAQETFASLTKVLGDQLCQKPIYRQAEVQEALAEGIVLPFCAPKAQAVAVCKEIARWIELSNATAISKAQMRWSER